MTPGGDVEPEYAWLRELIATRGEELRRRYGAHAVGIGGKKLGEGQPGQLALRVYVDPEGTRQAEGTEPVPPTIAFTPFKSHDRVHLPTEVVESPPAQFE